MEQECKCGCGETFKVNEAHPGILYKKGHKPKPVKIPCGCDCGTMINNIGKHGEPIRFANGHGSRMRRQEIGQNFKDYRKTPENVEIISKGISKSWEHRPRKRVYRGCLQMKCGKCRHEWIFSGLRQDGGAVCPNCKSIVNKRHAIEIDTSSFKKCKCGCGNPIPPTMDNKNIEYLQGHGPRGVILCKCQCGTLIENPDEWGRYREVVRGHNGPYIKLPTRPERKLGAVIKKFNLPFIYTGSKEAAKPIPGLGYRPDYTCTLCKLLLEVDGVHWHSSEKSKNRDAKRKEKLQNVGYSILEFGDDELLLDVNKQIKSERSFLSDEEIRDKILFALAKLGF